MDNEVLWWVVFNIFVLTMLTLDLKVFHRKAHDVDIKEALLWTAVWILLALLFNAGVYFWFGSQMALEFLTGYIIEKSLSVDNIFVFLLIFSYFDVPSIYQHKVLFYGIVGALVLRGIFILAGVTLIQKFHWIIYVFGGLLIFSGIRFALEKGKKIEPEKNPLLKLFRRFFPVLDHYENGRFFVKKEGVSYATPLFLVLLVVESSDIVFAADSIPAILAITRDPFIVYTSNVFAILGLRALYFALAGILERFEYLHYGLALILIFVGLKMTVSNFYDLPVAVALGVVAGILIISITISLVRKSKMSSR